MPKRTANENNVPIKTGGRRPDFLFGEGSDLTEHDLSLFGGEGQLACDVFQDNENIYVKTTIAGVDPDNLDISVTNDLLTIRGFRDEKSELEEKNYFCREIYWGAFSRSIVLPQEVDQKRVEAAIKSGVLTIKLPKKYKTAAIKVKNLD